MTGRTMLVLLSAMSITLACASEQIAGGDGGDGGDGGGDGGDVSNAITWDGGGDGVSWTDPLNWSGDQVPGPSDTAVVTTATVRHAADVTSSVLALVADVVDVTFGTLSVVTDATVRDLTIDTDPSINPSSSALARFEVAGTMDVTGDLVLRGGVLGGPGSVTVGGQTTLSGAGNVLDGVKLNSGGTASPPAPGGPAGALGSAHVDTTVTGRQCMVGGTIWTVKPGVTAVFSDADFYDGGDSWCTNPVTGQPRLGSGTIINEGTIQAINSGKTIMRVFFDNNGDVEIESGLELARSGSHTGVFRVSDQGFLPVLIVTANVQFLAGSNIEVGLFQVGGTVSVAGRLDAGQTHLSGSGAGLTIEAGAMVVAGAGYSFSMFNGRATFETAVQYSSIGILGGTFEVTNGVTVTTGFLSFGSGTLSGVGTTLVTDQLLMGGTGTDPTRFDGARLEFTGTLASWISGVVEGGNGAVFQNDGFFQISDITNLTWDGTVLGGTPMEFINNGTVVKVGIGTTTMTTCYSGTPIDVQDGAVNLTVQC